MKQKFLDSTVNFLNKYNPYSDEELKKLRYGLEGLYLTFTKLIILLALSIILGIFKEVILVIILFNILRYFGFGFHAEKSSECLLISTINFVLIPSFFINLDISLSISLVIAGACIVYYLIYAPADTVKRPLLNRKKRIIRKILTVITGSIYTLIIILINNRYITSLILSSLVIMAFVISPAIYKIFRQPYSNYKNFR